MRILTWNCNCAFRRKFHLLERLDADVMIIQECEDPSESTPAYRAWAANHLWTGTNKTKGLGIFAKGNQKLEQLGWSDNGASMFLPCRINDDLEIVSIWAQTGKSATDSYVAQLWRYLQLNHINFGEKTILAGDLNSNSQFDKPRQQFNHSTFVEELKKHGIVSLYHHFNDELHGRESRPTFYMQRNPLKPFHLDFAFAHTNLISNKSNHLWIGEPDEWLQHSDHLPIAFDI